jgi:scyllo-inositol 2-dehydrogenase (NADP+)
MNKINVAIVGFGLSGRYLQAPFFETNPDFQLKTVVTSQRALHETYPHVTKVGSLAEVLADASIDLVSIASPNNTHFDYAQQCLLAGKHVLVEKPFTANASEALALVRLAEGQQRQIFVFQNRRFDSDFLTVRKIIESGSLGELLRFEARYDRFKPLLNPKKWKETPGSNNGIFYDLGPHLIDQCIALFGEPKAVWGETYTQRDGSAIDDAFDLRLDFGKLKVQLSSSLLMREPTPRYLVQGTKGMFVKYGIDVQEDHLKAGMLPIDPGFGIESAEFQGVLNAEIDGIGFRGKVETAPGNWRALFQNMADVLMRGEQGVIRLEEILWQMRVLERARSLTPSF